MRLFDVRLVLRRVLKLVLAVSAVETAYGRLARNNLHGVDLGLRAPMTFGRSRRSLFRVRPCRLIRRQTIQGDGRGPCDGLLLADAKATARRDRRQDGVSRGSRTSGNYRPGRRRVLLVSPLPFRILRRKNRLLVTLRALNAGGLRRGGCWLRKRVVSLSRRGYISLIHFLCKAARRWKAATVDHTRYTYLRRLYSITFDFALGLRVLGNLVRVSWRIELQGEYGLAFSRRLRSIGFILERLCRKRWGCRRV